MTHNDPHDQAIEDVLHALRTTEPPQGYEARIHNALLQAQQNSRSNVAFSNRHPERSVAKSKDLLASLLPGMSWAAACAALLILGITVRSYMAHDTHPNTSPAAMTELTSSPRSHQNSPRVLLALEPNIVKSPTKHIIHKQQPQTEPQRIEVAIQTHEYIPEPPLPLTEQERMVRRMTRRNDAQQLAEYTPDERARQLHQDAEEYRKYFAATSLDGQPIYVQHIDHPQISGGN